MTSIDDFNTTIPQFGLMTGKTTTQAYAAAQRGEVRATLKGNRWMVSRSSIDEYLRKRAAAVEAAAQPAVA